MTRKNVINCKFVIGPNLERNMLKLASNNAFKSCSIYRHMCGWVATSCLFKYLNSVRFSVWGHSYIAMLCHTMLRFKPIVICLIWQVPKILCEFYIKMKLLATDKLLKINKEFNQITKESQETKSKFFSWVILD